MSRDSVSPLGERTVPELLVYRSYFASTSCLGIPHDSKISNIVFFSMESNALLKSMSESFCLLQEYDEGLKSDSMWSGLLKSRYGFFSVEDLLWECESIDDHFVLYFCINRED